MRGDIKFGWVSTSLGIADLDAIDEEIESTVNAVEAKSDLAGGMPMWRDLKGSSIRAGGVLGWGIRGACGEWIDDVCILWPAIPLELPVARNGDG